MSRNPKSRFVSGFVSIIGRPNVGKSTLLNALLGTKVAIVSDKPQTTRTSIQGVLNMEGAQIVFLDTPGIHRPDTLINKQMMNQVRGALDGRDLLLFVADCRAPIKREDEQAIALLTETSAPTILLLNKVDLLKDKARLLPLIARYQKFGKFEEFIPISALSNDGLDLVRDSIISRLPKGPQYFPADQVTDQPERFFAGEIIREKVLLETRQEIPHAVLVIIEKWEDSSGLLKIAASICVEREGQKAIIIGAKGSLLKQIGTLARQELEALLGRKIFLELFVKTRPKWREKPAFLSSLDWKH